MDRWILGASGTRRWVIVAVVVECMLIVGMLQANGLFHHVGLDFLTTWTAAEMVAGSDASHLYETRAQWEYQRPILARFDVVWIDRVMHPFIAPPLLAVLAVPLLPLGPGLAAFAWSALNALAVVIAIALIARHLDVDWRAATGIILGSLPLFYVLMLGQVEGFLFLALSVFVIELHAGRETRAGLALSALALKPPLLLAPLVFLAAARRGVALRSTLAAIAVQAAMSIAIVGPAGVRDYVALSRRLAGPDGTIVTNVWGMVNLRAVVVRAFPSGEDVLANLAIIGLTALMFGAAAWLWRRAGPLALSLNGLALLVVTMVLTAYHALYHTSLLALLGVILLLGQERMGDERLVSRLTMFSWAMFTVLPLACFAIVQSSKVPAMLSTLGLLLIWGVSAHALGQRAPVMEASVESASEAAELLPRRVAARHE